VNRKHFFVFFPGIELVKASCCVAEVICCEV
jgi:hypothetical protein